MCPGTRSDHPVSPGVELPAAEVTEHGRIRHAQPRRDHPELHRHRAQLPGQPPRSHGRRSAALSRVSRRSAAAAAPAPPPRTPPSPWPPPGRARCASCARRIPRSAFALDLAAARRRRLAAPPRAAYPARHPSSRSRSATERAEPWLATPSRAVQLSRCAALRRSQRLGGWGYPPSPCIARSHFEAAFSRPRFFAFRPRNSIASATAPARGQERRSARRRRAQDRRPAPAAAPRHGRPSARHRRSSTSRGRPRPGASGDHRRRRPGTAELRAAAWAPGAVHHGRDYRGREHHDVLTPCRRVHRPVSNGLAFGAGSVVRYRPRPLNAARVRRRGWRSVHRAGLAPWTVHRRAPRADTLALGSASARVGFGVTFFVIGAVSGRRTLRAARIPVRARSPQRHRDGAAE